MMYASPLIGTNAIGRLLDENFFFLFILICYSGGIEFEREGKKIPQRILKTGEQKK